MASDDKKVRFLAVLSVVLRLVLGGVFLTSGLQKLAHLDLFYLTAQGYKILTPDLIQLYVGWLPWLEILAGVCLLLGLFTSFAAVLASLLLASFLIALGTVLLRGDAIDCGCFLGGTQPSPVTWELWFRDLAMLAASVGLLFIKDRPWSLDRLPEKQFPWKKACLIVLALYGLGTGIAALSSKTPEPPPPPHAQQPPLTVGTLAPDFKMSDLDGKDYALSDYKGKKAVLVEVFATWCPHCQHSVPILKKLQQTYPAQLQILSINAGDQAVTLSTAAAFRKQYKITYPILDYPAAGLLDTYHVSGFPTVYLVDKTGKIVWNHVGEIDPVTATQLEQAVKAQ